MTVPTEILDILQSSPTMHSLCETYLRRVHSWLPMLSHKRLFQKVKNFSAGADMGLALLLLCMTLVSEAPSEQEQPATSPIYCMAKDFYSRVENS
jgi:hypothetical protein